MTEATTHRLRGRRSRLRSARCRSTSRPRSEIDTRLLGMIVALAVIWVCFNILVGRQLPHARATSGTSPSRAPRSRSWRRAWS